MENDRKVQYAHEMSDEQAQAIADAKPSPEAEALNYLLTEATGEPNPQPEQVKVEMVVVDDLTNSPTDITVEDPESTANPPARRSPGNPTVTQALQAELMDLAQKALNFKKLIKEAKTDAKKHYYKKKLTKNNEIALKVLVALDRITTNRAARANVKPKNE